MSEFEHDAAERPAETSGQLAIRDRAGHFPAETMRAYFEGAVRQTAVLQAHFPLNPVVHGKEFVEYVNYRTQAAWIGFALGMRTVQRMAEHAATKERAND